mmetsp:Transcript_25293/g.28049  ORF Transcript_25293/g.28049 Transcript_25293/m.28049 type:complete len:187 (-) Transcript_25293:309-869(-)|eukprot:CAMPEP_0205831938 /NCGR_PEP_ID=MMETSP0206-20130828/45556_1 /ASSEMBLY_ACC=CAM_ASM_000279 /TAXON_ID=36767 /ORGANISM="Euplotes focardii, Strain TN1" /LENGTH=186 /DNA_ID=CAMNT_0053137035 /DNA_START=18 /DNA_END=578 /DNA_ORIENTATION=+
MAAAAKPVAAACVGARQGPMDLLQFVDKASAQCLNNDEGTDVKSVICGPPCCPAGNLRSDADVDEQLLITIPFRVGVKIHSINIVAEEGKDDSSAPARVALFIDKPDMDFNDAEDTKPVQELNLTAKDTTGKVPVKLRYAKFQSVNSLTIFVATNQGDTEVTRLEKLQVFGTPIAGMDMSKLEKKG